MSKYRKDKVIFYDNNYLTDEASFAKARKTGMPVVNIQTLTTYWPSGHVSFPPQKRKMPKQKSVGRKGGNFRFTERAMPSDANMLAAVKIAEKNILKQTEELGGVCTTVDSAGTIGTALFDNLFMYCVNAPNTGPSAFQRRGNKTKNRNVRVYGIATHYSTATSSHEVQGNVLRMIVVWDKSPNGVLPTFNQIFGQIDPAGTTDTHLLDPKNLQNTERFQILRDKRFVSNPASFVLDDYGIAEQEYAYDEFIKLGDRDTQFSSANSSGEVGTISTGALYVIFRPSHGTADNHWFNHGTARLRFLP